MTELAGRLAVMAILLLSGTCFSGWLRWLLIGAAAAAFLVLLPSWLLRGAAAGYHLARELALADVQGQYYAFKGRPIGVVEDIDGWRWLRAADVRRVIPAFVSDRALLRIEPQRAASAPDGERALHVRSDALLAWLGRAQDAEAVRLKVWVYREVHFPSPAVRQARLGGAGTPSAAAG